MRLDAYLPLDITVTSYHPAVPARLFGPPEQCYPEEPAEIEFEVRTLTGDVLAESDFGPEAWANLCEAVLAAHEEARRAEAEDTAVRAWEGSHEF
jgi:hypothetical protein